MFRIIVLSIVVVGTYAGDLGGGYGGGLGLARGGLALGGGLGIGTGVVSGHASGPLLAAISSKRTYEVRPVLLQQEPAVPSVIEVEPSEQPVQVVFRSLSSPVLVQQIHTPGAPGQVEKTQSEDEPHRVVHEVLRPVIQEVREIIQPYRRVVQEVRPVLEEIHTVVAKGEGRLQGGLVGSGHIGGGYDGELGGEILLGGGGRGLAGGALGLKGGYRRKARA